MVPWTKRTVAVLIAGAIAVGVAVLPKSLVSDLSRAYGEAPRPAALGRSTSVLRNDRLVWRAEDPIAGTPVRIEGERDRSVDGVAGVFSAADGALKRPDASLRVEKSVSERGGIDPCRKPRPSKFHFTTWKPVSQRAHIAVPLEGDVVDRDGKFDLVLHFHGEDLAWLEFGQAQVNMVFFGMTSFRYKGAVGGPQGLASLIEATERAMSQHCGRKAQVRRLALGAWSAGFGAVRTLLEQSEDRERVDAVVLLDGLHGSRDPTQLAEQLKPFVTFGERAMRGEKFMFVSHSSVDTDGYASTTESVNFLLFNLKTRALAVRRSDPLGMDLVAMLDRGELHVRGYAGGGRADHCAQLALYPDVARALEKYFKQPRSVTSR